MTRRGRLYAHPTLAPPTSENDSSSSRLLKTPTSNLGSSVGPQLPAKRKAGGHRPTLEDELFELTLLPTPTVGNVTGGNKTRSGSRSDELLLPGVVAKLLPTPTAMDAHSSRNATANRRKPGGHSGTTLADVMQVSTGSSTETPSSDGSTS